MEDGKCCFDVSPDEEKCGWNWDEENPLNFYCPEKDGKVRYCRQQKCTFEQFARGSDHKDQFNSNSDTHCKTPALVD